MNLTNIHPDDVVELDVRGYQCFARVTRAPYRDPSLGRVLEVEPLYPGRKGGYAYLPTRFPTARQVIGHYAKRKAR